VPHARQKGLAEAAAVSCIQRSASGVLCVLRYVVTISDFPASGGPTRDSHAALAGAPRRAYRSTDAKQSSFDRGLITFISACAQRKGLRAQKQKKSIDRVSNSVPPSKKSWPFPLHHDTLHVHPSLKMQLYNPLTIVPSSGPLSLWPSHSFWDPNLIKKCPPVPTIIAWTRRKSYLILSYRKH
jgi:hypothetical protein